MKSECILIIGMHRSGTSALAGVLHHLGVYYGNNLTPATENNQKGYFENIKFTRINEKLLRSILSSWDDIFLTPVLFSENGLRDELKQLIVSEFEGHRLFAIKDPRISILLHVYTDVLEELNINIKIIIPYRNPIEVAKSLLKRNNFSEEKSIMLWCYYILHAEYNSRNYMRVFICFDDFIKETELSINSIEHHLNLQLKFQKNKQSIEEFLNPKLKHHNISDSKIFSKWPQYVEKIYQLKYIFNDKSIFQYFDEFREEFLTNRNFFYMDEVIAQPLTINKQLRTIEELISNITIEKKKYSDLSVEKNTLYEKYIKNKKQELERLEQKDNIIKKFENVLIPQKNKLITELNLQHSKQNEKLIAQSNKISEMKQMLQDFSQEISALKEEVVSIHNSRFWRYTRIIRRIIRSFQ